MQRECMFRKLTAIEIAEGALLADIGSIFQLLAIYIPIGKTIFHILTPIVFAIIVLRCARILPLAALLSFSEWSSNYRPCQGSAWSISERRLSRWPGCREFWTHSILATLALSGYRRHRQPGFYVLVGSVLYTELGISLAGGDRRLLRHQPLCAA